ncbi:hypothetical protein DC522_22475 [Microvirga sp. KLBC 81]|uniref:hypothetical protein n=1 Tax=Microvirga sp. KLBC 81 TaxID=1862707 RepID=UPI000D50EF53|nr:hypothetical protein [Microvirga sp. KLBC 81]PVE22174.1 hypothetical protein DC522_22475 [Microvirga sp. KLBC 81]
MNQDLSSDETVKVMAQLAGLQKALEEFPADVALAVQDAAHLVAQFTDLMMNPDVEPWPPMRVRDSR